LEVTIPTPNAASEISKVVVKTEDSGLWVSQQNELVRFGKGSDGTLDYWFE
jgi:hypothetical protein